MEGNIIYVTHADFFNCQLILNPIQHPSNIMQKNNRLRHEHIFTIHANGNGGADNRWLVWLGLTISQFSSFPSWETGCEKTNKLANPCQNKCHPKHVHIFSAFPCKKFKLHSPAEMRWTKHTLIFPSFSKQGLNKDIHRL